jgi:hypothetical protein
MKDEKIRIEPETVDALSLELEIEPPAADGDARPRRPWTDAFRASGMKHAVV